VVHYAGGSEAQELAYALAVAIAYLIADDCVNPPAARSSTSRLAPVRSALEHRQAPYEGCGHESRKPAGLRPLPPSSPPRPPGG
jgi:hypothetical protein